MAGPAALGEGVGMAEIEIREAVGEELVQGSALLARSLAFGERDAVPPWLIQTAAGCGGLALAALDGAEVVGFSFAIPADGGALFSCGLAVAPGCRGQGVGRRLKLAQRERALAQGRSRIRWTADPLSASALALYLPGLGARLVAYEPELYAAVRPALVPPDDVTIDWPLEGGGGAGAGVAPAASVEVPFDHRALATDELAAWRARVRRAMRRALDRGAVGTGVAIDRASRRAWVLFSEAAR
jgi:predicted GNAT superfamily acetyltransferase